MDSYDVAVNRCMPVRALLSVSDKTGLLELAKTLVQYQVHLISTGGTAKYLLENGISVEEVSDYTGFPEILGGRVKTLHPKIYAGILSRRAQDAPSDKTHLSTLQIPVIDLLIVNLYPFEATIADPNCTEPHAIEHIDIGGPTLLRAAAKNFAYTAAVVSPADYGVLQQELHAGGILYATRRAWATKVFQHTARYDATIYQYLNHTLDNALPETLSPMLIQQQPLRYGENPHQQAAFYRDTAQAHGIAALTQHQGKPLSYNNLVDADAALSALKLFDSNPTCVIVKHATPCGIAAGLTLNEAYSRAYQADPTSAFGGIIALNQTLDAETAAHILAQQFVELIIAPSVAADASHVLAQKPAVRVLTMPATEINTTTQAPYQYRSITGGVLVQTPDLEISTPHTWTVVTTRVPTAQEMEDLTFAWNAVRSVKSNAIVYAKNKQTLGIGAGQPNRISSAKIGIDNAETAGFSVIGAVMASDAFFPFADSVEMAAKHGVAAIVQPGGSIRDQDVIAAANLQGIAMVFTGLRHFKH